MKDVDQGVNLTQREKPDQTTRSGFYLLKPQSKKASRAGRAGHRLTRPTQTLTT